LSGLSRDFNHNPQCVKSPASGTFGEQGMSIPNTLDRSHLIKAIQQIKLKRRPETARLHKIRSTVQAWRLSPQVCRLSLANTFLNGRELCHFSGGKETNNFLIARGLPDIVNKKTGQKIGIEPEDEDDSKFYAEGGVFPTLCIAS
jgi:hypothetical protein